MGLTKQYLKYELTGVFGLVGTTRSNIVLLPTTDQKGQLCAVGACEHVFIWDLRKAYKVRTLAGERHEVSSLAASPDKKHLAVGYTDGTVKVFDFTTGDVSITFSGHRSAVTALNYDSDGIKLVSGSKDTDVIVWDIINESGLFRLKGHKGMITQARFLVSHNILVTSSKDTYVKFWDMDTQHCFRTLVGHRTEVWDFVIGRNDQILITGSADNEIRVWKLEYLKEDSASGERTAKKAKFDDGVREVDSDEDEEEEESDENILTCRKVGSLMRHGKDRVMSLQMDPTGRVFGCHGSDSLLELFRINSEAESKKHMMKKQKKANRKAREAGDDEEAESVKPTVESDVRRLNTVKMSSKLRSFDCIFDSSSSNEIKVVGLLVSNVLESCMVDTDEKKSAATSVTKLSIPSHRTDVRTMSFSSDNTAILSAGGDTVKVWNRDTLQCIRTMSCDYALCSMFAPGDRHLILGTKSGKIQLFDLAAGSLLEEIDAHEGAVWSISLAPDKRSIVSGSADKEVKFWDFELISDEEHSKTSKRLSLAHTRTLKMAEDVLCVKYSPDQKFLAVSLLDNTVKVFFADTLKFFLSLYGHKLPVLSLDISTDGSLLVTGSADRNVKLWGLDFGDCHKSIFAHDDSIMSVAFVPKTHMFFTVGKDGKLKEWDGDSFEHIQTLEGHHSEIWSLAISPSGNFVITGSHDKSLRLWEKTEEVLVLDLQREIDREKEYEHSLAKSGKQVIPGESNEEADIAGKTTVESIKSTERIIEALVLYKQETEKLSLHEAECRQLGKQLPPPAVHPMMQAFQASTPTRYVLEVIKRVRSSELEECLLVLPFAQVIDLLGLLNEFIQKEWEIELSCRCLLFLLRIHQAQITSNQVLLPVIDRLRTNATSAVDKLRDLIGFNLAGLKFLKMKIEEQDEVSFFTDATDRLRQKRKREKKKAILTLKT